MLQQVKMKYFIYVCSVLTDVMKNWNVNQNLRFFKDTKKLRDWDTQTKINIVLHHLVIPTIQIYNSNSTSLCMGFETAHRKYIP